MKIRLLSLALVVGGLVVYATDLKHALAGVRSETLARAGAVSPETAAELAVGAARTCGATWGVATTGVAGPDRQEGHPAGTVFVAVARPTDPEWERVEPLTLAGDRESVRRHTVEHALALLADALDAEAPG